MKLKFLTILLVLLCAIPVMVVNASPWIYETNTSLENQTLIDQPLTLSDYPMYYYTIQDQIVMNTLNKQNELLEELVRAQWVETCYAPHTAYTGNFINLSAWKSECANAGYPVD
jgi:hypothetical protein